MGLGKAWGRRPYAGKEAREQLNDVSTRIARTRPDWIDDPDDPTLADVIRFAQRCDGLALTDQKSTTLSELMGHGLTFQEAVCWYWFRYAQLDMVEIHYAMEGHQKGGDPSHRRNNVRNIRRVLTSAAEKLPDVDVDDVPDLDLETTQ